MARTMNESVLEMLEAIYTELKSIKKQLKPNNELKELKERLSQLEARVVVLETCNIHQSPFTSPYTSPYQPPIMFGDSNTGNISNLSKETDSGTPNIVNLPHIAKEFRKK